MKVDDVLWWEFELCVLELLLPYSLLSLQIQVLLIQQLQNITS